mgnify:CR=1 FL=1|tara:strand:- start:455 stop:616 length:162 start_codon:yes stop_codon:yes gene_type:complete
MIKSVELVELPLFDKQDNMGSFIRVELDNEFLMFNEEELTNAAALAKKDGLND